MLEIKNLRASIDGKEILKGINLNIEEGKVYAIMGPNGSGKSTLASVLAGNELKPEERAAEGVFLAFQYPVEIPGVSINNFMKAAVNEQRHYHGLEPMPAPEFLKLIKEKKELVELDKKLDGRSVNQGFSGGEKKKLEVFQMAVLNPKVAVLDETDSGLDIDALRIVANGVNKLKNSDNAFIIITHYQRLLDYITPDVVHVLYNGRIIKTGDKNLALELEKTGYDELKKQADEQYK